MASVSVRDEHPGVFRAGGISPHYMIQMVSLAFCLGGLVLVFQLWQAPNHPLISRQAHLAWTGILALLALAAPVAARSYGRRLAVELRLNEDRTLRVKDGSLLGASWRTVALDDIASTELKRGGGADEAGAALPRVRVVVRGHRDFTVPLGRGREQRERVVALLRGEPLGP